MPQDAETSLQEDATAEVLQAIATFEQILEAMPGDRSALEALFHAHQQAGANDKAKEYLVRLADALLLEGDLDAASALAQEMRLHGAQDPVLADVLGRLEAALAGHAGPSAPAVSAATPDVDVSSAFTMAEELSFVWSLMEVGEITQDEYAAIVQDLTEMAASDSGATVSALHAMEGRGFKKLERIIIHAAKSCETPYIALASFEIRTEAVTVLPMDFILNRGALVFDLLGNEALAAILNPFDQNLRRDVRQLTGRPCHFYVTKASEFDATLDRIADVGVEASGVETQA